ncbi:LOW QUALITY PROTEIN: SET domain-containing protein 9 [Bufo gargarizans]|uniref:LOW QUALITY PROTEIN: SET domain-containing protein 9 n=1 Tax=Bufo gargarizans TaxID=30331 RepID=UPI001CF4F1C5|nr:LOW QUALITY PROTEIN: SET domain-containing protein 9 [Bufo gargarizans]
MASPGSVLRALLTRWRSYKYRFVPWVALNLARNRRTLRHVTSGGRDKVAADAEVCSSMVAFFQALFTSDIGHQRELLDLLPASTRAMYPAAPDASEQAVDVMYKCLGFSIDRRLSSLDAAGTGVFVSKGLVPKGALVSMYPGAVYQCHEPIFFQSIGNPFIFRCLDGILIDGNDRGISKSVYRSCSGRDRLGPLEMCDCTWLDSAPRNPLAVGQYVNNCSNERAANVCYQEFDVPPSFPVELRQYIPNIRYSYDVDGPLRCVVLVALRDIRCGEELFSNYFTLVE